MSGRSHCLKKKLPPRSFEQSGHRVAAVGGLRATLPHLSHFTRWYDQATLRGSQWQTRRRRSAFCRQESVGSLPPNVVHPLPYHFLSLLLLRRRRRRNRHPRQVPLRRMPRGRHRLSRHRSADLPRPLLRKFYLQRLRKENLCRLHGTLNQSICRQLSTDR